MKFRARFPDDSEDRELDLCRETSAFEAVLDGAPVAGDARETSEGVWSVVSPGGRQIEVGVLPGKDGTVRVTARGIAFSFEFLDAREAAARAALAAVPERAGNRALDVRAAMPGRILRVLVEKGARVASGQGLVVLEAMKMENEVRAPREGVVAALPVSAGSTVSAGDVLVRFEEEGE